MAVSSKGHAIEAPKELGKYRDWTAAIYVQSGNRVCYAFTRAKSSRPSLPDRGPVILTLTQRPSSGMSVAMEIGFTYPSNARVTVDVAEGSSTSIPPGTTPSPATAGRPWRHSSAAVTPSRTPPPRTASDVADTFSLLGFTAAHDAILKACPGK